MNFSQNRVTHLAKSIWQFAVLMTLLSSSALGEEKKKPVLSVRDLLLASERLQLTNKQETSLTKIERRMISELDWLARTQSDREKRTLKFKTVQMKSLESGLKLLNPEQKKLWRQSQAPDPKPPKKKKQ